MIAALKKAFGIKYNLGNMRSRRKGSRAIRSFALCSWNVTYINVPGIKAVQCARANKFGKSVEALLP